MKKITLLLLCLFTAFSMTSQVFPEGFESGVPPTDWTFFRGTNGEGDGFDWITSNSAASGSQAAYVRYENVANEAEDWLVTPQFTPTAAANILTFQQRQSFGTVYNSVYTIRVSTVSQTTHADFTTVDSYTEADFGTVYSARNVDLSDYDGIPIYVAFVMTNDDGDSWYVDDVDLIANATAPDCASNPTPADGATDVALSATGSVSIAWDAPTTGDAPTSYEVLWGTVSGSITSLGEISATTVNISGIDYNTTYYWSIVPKNVGGSATGCAEWSFTTQGAPLPYTEEFDNYLPTGWTEANGDYGSPSGTASGWTGDDFVNDTGNTNGRSAKINIYGDARNEYMITPEFDLSGGTYYLNFDIGLTPWNGTSSSNLGSDDFVALLVTQDDGATWTELTRWDANSTISEVGEAASEIPLSGYGASVKFAFFATAGTVSDSEDNDFFIDNFQVTTTTLSTDENTLIGFSLYPTVVKDELNYTSINEVQAISVYNLLGQEVLRKTSNFNETPIIVSSLKAGMYMVRVQAGNAIGTYKIIKE